MDLERAVYELYKDMPEGDADEVDTLQFDAAFALCNGVQAAEIAAQRLYSCSLFDVFDLYFRIPRANITEEICDIKLSKRVTMLPSHPMESVMNLIHTYSKCSLAAPFEKHMKSRKKDLLALPVRVGPAGGYGVEIMVASKYSCSFCNKPRSEATMKCSCGCAYCCKTCQKQHWKWHKRLEH